MSQSRRRPGRSVVIVLTAIVALAATVSLPSVAGARSRVTKPVSSTGIAHWRLLGSYLKNSVNASEGVATVTRSNHTRYELYRGLLSVPKALAAHGWSHIGDPDSAAGDIIDAYQGPSTRPSKMFLVTTASGATVEYVHRLVPHELYNNSFDAISPDTKWMVAGEWRTMTHLQIYPTPRLNHATPRRGGSLRLAGYIRLDHKVNDIQGCDFTGPTTLICVSDDSTHRFFTNSKPLLEVELGQALNGRNVTGHVIDLGSIPQRSTCTGTFEAEGVDYDVATGVLRVEIIQPASCIIHTTIYKYAPAKRS